MLRYLHIENLAVVEDLELELEPGFTVITGETGAGKSILIKGISLLLGARADADMLRSGAERAVVEGEFYIGDTPQVRQVLADNDLLGDETDILHVRRIFGASRMRVMLNGQLATVALLGKVCANLIELSGQHDHQLLTRREYHLDLLDRFANLEAETRSYRQLYEDLREKLAERDQLERDHAQRDRLIGDLEYDISELEKIAPRPGEDVELQYERQRLANVARLREHVGLADQILYSGQDAAIDRFGRAATALRQAATLDSSLAATAAELDNMQDLLGEASRQLASYLDHLEDDPVRLDTVEERLDDLRRLMRKHGGDLEALVSKREELSSELDRLRGIEQSTALLETEIEQAQAALAEQAKILSQRRHEAAATLPTAIEHELAALEMPHARLRVEVTPFNRLADGIEYAGQIFGPRGAESLELLFSPNPGQEARPLAKIASGGELSRVMLAFKVVLAGRDQMSAYVFDEVDTGVGGAMGEAIGAKVHLISRDRQALVITHLPQLAAWADHHVLLAKEVAADSTKAYATHLDAAAREQELARMLDGVETTGSGREHARSLLRSAAQKRKRACEKPEAP